MSELTRLQVIALRDLAFSCLPEAEQERIHRNAKVSGMGDVAYKTDFSAMGAFPSVRLEPTLPPTKTAIEQAAGKVLFLTTRHPLTYTPHPTSTPEEIQREQEVAERDRAVIERLLYEAVAELCELAEVAPPHWLQQGQRDGAESQQDETPGQDSGPVPNWKLLVQAEAAAMFKRQRAMGAQPTVYNIIDAMARWCRENDVRTSTGAFPSASYLRVHVLGGKHWKPPE